MDLYEESEVQIGAQKDTCMMSSNVNVRISEICPLSRLNTKHKLL